MNKQYLFLLIFSAINIQSTFYFQTHKTDLDYVTGILRPDFLRELRNVFNASIFIETGTFQGGTTFNASQIFNSVYSSELYPPLYNESKIRLGNSANIKLYNLHSADFLTLISNEINETPVFWLDAHYSGPNTAFSSEDHSAMSAMTPIREELAAIKKGYQNGIILIDDMRCFGTEESNIFLQAQWGYPSVQEVKKILLEINKNFDFALIGDTLMAYDKQFSISFSDIVKACTISRLYDGHNYSDQELFDAEQIIRAAQASEKLLINVLNSIVSRQNDYHVYHYTLWKGLTMLDSNPAESCNYFRTVLNKYSYDHWRIKRYLAQAEMLISTK